ncbi:MAG: 3-isopropylmalate/(R)-2-methylmalate dehydratase large subunit, partial [Myxococcota bacterium]
MKPLAQRLWDDHVVAHIGDRVSGRDLLYVDLHLVHEVTSPQAFTALRERGLSVRCPQRTVATMDHSTPTQGGLAAASPKAAHQLATLDANCREFGIQLHALDSAHHGIVHIIGPQLGLTQPGMTVVCGDSHTSTHGAFGALAFGIGTSEVATVFATQSVFRRRPRSARVRVDGRLAAGVTAKDLILAVIAQVGTDWGAGHVIEYAGSTIQSLSMDQRMTICNMSIEAGATAGLIAPDDVTFAYLKGRPGAPSGADWNDAVRRWRSLASPDNAVFDREVELDAATVEPMLTWGTTPAAGIGVTGCVPDPDGTDDPAAREALERALTYMQLDAGKPLLGRAVDVVFVGSCTNGR